MKGEKRRDYDELNSFSIRISCDSVSGMSTSKRVSVSVWTLMQRSLNDFVRMVSAPGDLRGPMDVEYVLLDLSTSIVAELLRIFSVANRAFAYSALSHMKNAR